VKFAIGGAMEVVASAQFIDAWHRAERGENFPQGLKPTLILLHLWHD
jgi:hypothetical protein